MFELIGVCASSKLVHVVSDQSGMSNCLCRPFFIVRCRNGIQKCLEWHFCVNHDSPTAGKIYDHIWTLAVVLITDGFLLREVAVLRHAGEFRNPSQGKFSPPSSNLWCPKRSHQAACFSL